MAERELETLQRWAATRQLVTTGSRSGRVYGYVAIDGDPCASVAQVAITTIKPHPTILKQQPVRETQWIPLIELRELGLRPGQESS